MASTFTTGFGIEKIGSGEQSGAWGTTTNHNLDILDRIASYKAVALSGTTHTLTVREASPGSGTENLQDGMYRVIKFTGALGANNTVTIAPNTAPAYFIFENATTDSASSGPYSVILTQGSGANITIQNGKNAIVYCDGAGSGAAVVNALSDLQIATLEVTGAAAIDGALTAAAIAATTVTTSGIVSVDDTTTSTSGTTGSIHTDGGLGVAGTAFVAGTAKIVGVTTHGGNVVSDTDSTDDLGTTSTRWKELFVDAITATDQVTATGFTGTLDGILGSGSAAAATVTTLNTTGAVTFNDAGADVDFRVESDGNANMLFVDGGNNRVGIGTASPVANLGLVGGTSNATNLSTAYSTAAFNITPKSTSGYSLAFGSGPSDFPYIQMSAGGSSAHAMSIQPYGGMLGVGATAPAYTLDVTGTGRFTDSVRILTGATTTSGLILGGDATAGNTWTIARDNVSTGDLKFISGTSERARIAADGKVSIGTTAASSKLHVYGTGGQNDYYTNGDTVNQALYLQASGGASGDGGQILFGASQGVFAGIKGFINNGTGPAGSLFFQTRSTSGNVVSRMSIASGGTVNVVGTFTAGTKTFRIAHPLPAKNDTHYLLHSSIEGPQADLIYRGRADLVSGTVDVNIDTAADMSEGTFEVLCTDVQCFTSNEDGWTTLKGSVTGNVLTITAQDNTCTDTVSWMVIGERKDAKMIESEWADDDGKLIVETLKSEHE